MQHTSSSREDLVPGRKPVRELLRESPEKVQMVYIQEGSTSAGREIADLCRQHHIRYRIAAKMELDRLYPGNHQGVLAKVFAQGFLELPELIDQALAAPLPLLLALDQVQDPGNVGALARTLYALGGGGIVLPKHEGAGLGPGAAKASAGALGRLPVAMAVNLSRALEECRDMGFAIYCAAMGGDAEPAWDAEFRLPAVLVLGSEGKGIRQGVAKRCDRQVFIPFLREFDSLNVAQAGAILIARFAAGAGRTKR